MREIVLDTETTGLDPAFGHRIVEIGCVELFNYVPTGREYHRYVNPERDMPEDAQQVHGITAAFLADKPVFGDIADEFLDFVGSAPLIIHNGAFDMKFLNYELASVGRPRLAMDRLVCTLEMCRRKFFGAPASLDALCRRFDIDLSVRDKHGALVDCTLLAKVYLELIGGRQPDLGLGGDLAAAAAVSANIAIPIDRPVRPPRPHAPSAAELAAHAAFLEKLSSPMWLQMEA